MDLDPKKVRLRRDGEALYLDVAGDRRQVERVAKAFPRTSPDRYIGLLDPEGHEIGLIEDPSQLDADSREILEAEIRKSYYVPTVSEILSVEPKGTGTQWVVITEEGEKTFRVPDRDALDGSDAPSLLITDDQGKRYRIEDYWAMDRESRDAIRDLLPDRVLRMRYGSGHGHGRHG